MLPGPPGPLLQDSIQGGAVDGSSPPRQVMKEEEEEEEEEQGGEGWTCLRPIR